MAEYRQYRPKTIINSGTGTDWTDPGNAAKTDDTRATAALVGTASTKWLWCAPLQNPELIDNPAIPTGATITGIMVYAEGGAAAGACGLTAQLIVGGALAGSAKTSAVNAAMAGDDLIRLGAANDVWGATLTPAAVNAADFGVAVAYDGTDVTVRCDAITVRIYYTTPSLVANLKTAATNLMAPASLIVDASDSQLKGRMPKECWFSYSCPTATSYAFTRPGTGEAREMRTDQRGHGMLVAGFLLPAGNHDITVTITHPDGTQDSDTLTVSVAADTRRSVYVAADGVIGNSGLSSAAPKGTLGQAFAIAADNDLIIIKGGDAIVETGNIALEDKSNVLIEGGERHDWGTGAPLLTNATICTIRNCPNFHIRDVQYQDAVEGVEGIYLYESANTAISISAAEDAGVSSLISVILDGAYVNKDILIYDCDSKHPLNYTTVGSTLVRTVILGVTGTDNEVDNAVIRLMVGDLVSVMWCDLDGGAVHKRDTIRTYVDNLCVAENQCQHSTVRAGYWGAVGHYITHGQVWERNILAQMTPWWVEHSLFARNIVDTRLVVSGAAAYQPNQDNGVEYAAVPGTDNIVAGNTFLVDRSAYYSQTDNLPSSLTTLRNNLFVKTQALANYLIFDWMTAPSIASASGNTYDGSGTDWIYGHSSELTFAQWQSTCPDAAADKVEDVDAANLTLLTQWRPNPTTYPVSTADGVVLDYDKYDFWLNAVSADPGSGAVDQNEGTEPLTAGVLSDADEATATSLGVTWTAGSGGTGTITSQLQIRASGVGSYTDVIGETSSPATAGSLTASTQYDLRVAYTDETPTTVYSNVVTLKTLMSVAAGTSTNGYALNLTFSEPVTGVNSGDFVLGEHTFGEATGSGTDWVLPIIDPVQVTETDLALDYNGTTIIDADEIPLATFEGMAVTNNSETESPTLAVSIAADGSGVFTFSEAVTLVSLDDFALSGSHTLSNLAGSGAVYTFTITPRVNEEETLTFDYDGTSIVDLVGNHMAAVEGGAVSNGSTVPTKPTAPTNLRAVFRDGAIDLTWTAATDDVGVTGYVVYATISGATQTVELGNVTSVTLTSSNVPTLANGVVTRIAVTAFDADEKESDPSNAVTGTPGPATAVSGASSRAVARRLLLRTFNRG